MNTTETCVPPVLPVLVFFAGGLIGCLASCIIARCRAREQSGALQYWYNQA